ncbi:MAG: beta-ketoacyl-ACP synthase III [Candidatus Coatesbacteria bacterium]
MSRTAAIVSTGMYVPPRVMTNADLAKLVETSDEWIVTRTGIRERRIAAPEQATSDLAAEASKQALERAGIAPTDVDLIILATLSPDTITPSSACVMQAKIGASRAAALDISAACSGFVYGLSLARGAIVSGEAGTVLLVGAEVTSKFMDWTDRANCVLFGDAAGAVVMRPSDGDRGVLGTVLGADGSMAPLIAIAAGGSRTPASAETVEKKMHTLRVRGGEVFKAGVRTMAQSVRDVLAKCGLKQEDLALLIPHQANQRIIAAVADSLEMPIEKVFMNLEKYGNTSAATIPVALHEAVEQGRLKPGDLVGVVAFGGGITWGAAVIRW